MRQSFTDDIGFFTRVHNAIIHVEYTSFHRGSPHSIFSLVMPDFAVFVWKYDLYGTEQ